MRTPSDQDTALRTHPTQARQVWLRVEMERAASPLWGSETWVDLSDFLGRDWVLDVSYEEDIDKAAWGARITLIRQFGKHTAMSLSPLMTSSLPNDGGTLIDPYNKVRISTATAPLGTPKASATFVQVFVGRINDWSIDGNQISVNCRDRTAELQDYPILLESIYGSDTPATALNNELEDRIQDVLDDHYNTTTPIGGSAGSPYTLYSRNGTSGTPYNASDVTNFGMRLWTQKKMPVWQAISAMAANIQWRLRFRWHEGTGIDDFVLVLEEPNRSLTAANIALDPKANQVRIDSASLSLDDIRNFWRVSYALNGGESRSYQAGDASSQSRYGYRPAELEYGTSALIDNLTEATTLGDSLLDDTKEPTVYMQLTLPYAWYLQIDDYITVRSDDRISDTDIKVAIISRRSMISRDGVAQTQLLCGGKRKAGVKSIIKRQRMYNYAKGGPSSLASSIKYGGLMVNGDFGDLGDE